jgi:putative DNA primase/helicase
MSDDIQEFISAMRASGVDPVEPIAGALLGGKVIRFRCQGDGRKRNGWALFFPAEGASGRAGGVFGNHKQNTGTIKWQADRAMVPLSAGEREAMRRQWREDAAQRARDLEAAQIAARAEALRIWDSASAASPAHEYAAKKRMRVGGLRRAGGALLVPMRDIDGTIWNLQRIYPDGTKRFLKGGRIIGLCAVIGMRPGFPRGVFAEGYATGDAISQAIGGSAPVVVAFNTANLDPVVAAWTKRFPLVDWIIAADDDHATGLKMVERGEAYQNPGIEKAEAAAGAHGCRVAYPPSFIDRMVDSGIPPVENTDFSDLLLAGRMVEVAEAINGALRKIDPAGASLSLAERIGRAVA